MDRKTTIGLAIAGISIIGVAAAVCLPAVMQIEPLEQRYTEEPRDNAATGTDAREPEIESIIQQQSDSAVQEQSGSSTEPDQAEASQQEPASSMEPGFDVINLDGMEINIGTTLYSSLLANGWEEDPAVGTPPGIVPANDYIRGILLHKGEAKAEVVISNMDGYDKASADCIISSASISGITEPPIVIEGLSVGRSTREDMESMLGIGDVTETPASTYYSYRRINSAGNKVAINITVDNATNLISSISVLLL
jgi:hypothetical protein